jgi:hypothetical protein
LLDTKALVYPFDWRFAEKQRVGSEILRAGIAEGTLAARSRSLARGAIGQSLPGQ